MEENFYPIPDEEVPLYKQKLTSKYINLSNFARKLSHYSNCVTILLVDACRDIYHSHDLNIDDSELPLKDTPQMNGQSIILYSTDTGGKATEWAPHPLSQLHYCEGTYEFIKHIDRCLLNRTYTVGDFVYKYKYCGISELYPRVISREQWEGVKVFNPLAV